MNGDTADEFSEVKIAKIINSLKNGSYQPSAVRRTYIAKANNSNKKRQLGIPTFTDKLVQEVLRMVLEAAKMGPKRVKINIDYIFFVKMRYFQ